MICIGIMGLGQIVHRVAKEICYAEDTGLYAVGSRSLEETGEFQRLYGAQKTYDSCERLLQDPRVEMVHICTPNHLRFEHTQNALRHGKHVLCEKPLAVSAEQLKKYPELARNSNLFLMEAEKALFMPLNRRPKQLVEEGMAGQLRYVEGSYSYPIDLSEMGEDHWCSSKEAGGSVYDVGAYPICYVSWFSDGCISDIQAIKDCTAGGYDMLTQALLTYDDGVVASVYSGQKQWMDNRGVLCGSEGSIKTENLWKSTQAILKRDGICIPIEADMKSDFTGEMEHVAVCIQQGLLESPILGEQQSAEIMKVLEYVKSL